MFNNNVICYTWASKENIKWNKFITNEEVLK